jgi:phosphate acetyltransferase
VIEAGMMTVGLAADVTTPSSFFLMVMANGATYVFADCALNIEPNSAELADIAIASARSRSAVLGDTPLVALLSFSTKGSGAHERVDKVREAARIAAEKAPDIAFDGELQADAALDAAVGAKKGAVGPVAGNANVLVFPDLDSGNIGYKLVQRLAGAKAIGPFLQGFAKPICDLSRGANVDDVVMAAAIALAAAK